jgi:hypothetical protein
MSSGFLRLDEKTATGVEQDRHTEGLFSGDAWRAWFDEAGFGARIHHDQCGRDLCVAVKR